MKLQFTDLFLLFVFSNLSITKMHLFCIALVFLYLAFLNILKSIDSKVIVLDFITPVHFYNLIIHISTIYFYLKPTISIFFDFSSHLYFYP